MTVGFLYGAGAETLIFVTGTSRKKTKFLSSDRKIKVSCVYPQKPRKIGVWVSGAEIQPQRWIPELRVWVSTLRKFPKSFWEKHGIFLENFNFRGVSAPALYKNPAVSLHRQTDQGSSPRRTQQWETDFYPVPVLRGSVLFPYPDFSSALDKPQSAKPSL